MQPRYAAATVQLIIAVGAAALITQGCGLIPGGSTRPPERTIEVAGVVVAKTVGVEGSRGFVQFTFEDGSTYRVDTGAGREPAVGDLLIAGSTPRPWMDLAIPHGPPRLAGRLLRAAAAERCRDPDDDRARRWPDGHEGAELHLAREASARQPPSERLSLPGHAGSGLRGDHRPSQLARAWGESTCTQWVWDAGHNRSSSGEPTQPSLLACCSGLFLASGSGVTMTDGPLPLGDYSYVAVMELANGAKVATQGECRGPRRCHAARGQHGPRGRQLGDWPSCGRGRSAYALIVTAPLIQTRTPAERPSTWMTSGSSSLPVAMSCPLARRSRCSSTAAS
jgi:hypothetical protein